MTIDRFRRLLMLWIAMTFAAATPAAAPTSPANDPGLPKSAVDSERYLLGPGDVIQVFVFQNSELSTTTPVLPDGTVTTPLANGIIATGKTPEQLARDIENALSEYVKAPHVSVSVTAPKSSNSQVRLTGEFNKPQSIPYQDGMTVMDAVLAVGGLSPYAKGSNARIQRKVDGKDKDIPVNLKKLMEKGDRTQDLPLQPGDMLFVPKTLL
jgi:polysaccharide biosynthesis/export protein